MTQLFIPLTVAGGPDWQQGPLCSVLPGKGLMEVLPLKGLEFSNWRDSPSIASNFLGGEAPDLIWELVPGQANAKMGVVPRLGPK